MSARQCFEALPQKHTHTLLVIDGERFATPGAQPERKAPMTKRKAEVLTGNEIRQIPHNRNSFCFGAFDCDQLIAEVEHRNERIALTWLVNAVYRMHSRQVLDQHGWRCARCGSSYLLQVHHRKYRSHGGTHRPENLEPTCGDCHRTIHAHAPMAWGTMPDDGTQRPSG